jgi:hypothetical protein
MCSANRSLSCRRGGRSVGRAAWRRVGRSSPAARRGWQRVQTMWGPGVAVVGGRCRCVGARGVERGDDGAAADVGTEARGLEPDTFGGAAKQLVDLLAGDEATIWQGEHGIETLRLVYVDLPHRPGDESLLGLTRLPSTEAFDSPWSQMVDASRSGGLRRADASTIGCRRRPDERARWLHRDRCRTRRARALRSRSRTMNRIATPAP